MYAYSNADPVYKYAYAYTDEVFIIVTDYTRYEYRTTFYTDKGWSYELDDATIFETYDDALYTFHKLIKGGKRVRDYFGDLTGREICVLKVIGNINTNKIEWGSSKTLLKSIQL